MLDDDALPERSLTLEVVRDTRSILRGEAALRLEAPPVADWIAWLYREMNFPHGAFLMLGLPFAFLADFTLRHGDSVSITDGMLTLENIVA
jgi:2-dehydro-3-deoxy-D-arabinonate dehydratase